MEMEMKLYEIYTAQTMTETERNHKIFSLLYPQFLNKKIGAFFTPPYIANRITNLVFQEGDIAALDKRVLDPACGGGEFLIAASNLIYHRYIKDNPPISVEKSVSIRQRIVANCIFGYDIDRDLVRLCRFRLLLWSLIPLYTERSISFAEVEKLIDEFECNIEQRNFFEEFNINNKFDAILCNPPYNAEITEMRQKRLHEIYPNIIRNSAAYFYLICESLVKKGGILGFIMPKSLVYSKRWRSLKKHIHPYLIMLLDISKAFKQVKLEEIILISNVSVKNLHYITQKGEDNPRISIDKSSKSEDNSWILELTADEFSLYEKIAAVRKKLGDYVKSYRGMNVQKLAIPFNKNEKDCIYCLEGGRLRPFHLLPIKRIIKNPQSTKKIEKYEKGMIIGQLANAHVKNPKPHYKLAFCFSPKSSKFISFDTVINISHSLTDYNSELLNSYIICYLNSNVFAWYLYKIVYAGAIRSTRLDYEYLKQVPFIPLNEISGNLFILWFFLAKSLEYLAYGQINLKNSSKDINFTQNQLKKIMNIGIFLLFLSKQDLDTRMDSFQINWQELEILSKKLNEIIDLELISMITKQRNQFTKEFNIYKKKIAHCSQTLWNGGFHELFKIIKEKIEWNLINIPDY